MREKKEYRSSLRSKKLIREAFLELLKVKEYEKITVTNIVDKADINRATFYAHYPDVRGLTEEIEKEILLEMYQALEGFDYNTFFDDPEPIIREIVEYLEIHGDEYRILLASSGAGPFLDKLKTMFEQYMQAIDIIPPKIRNSPVCRIRLCYFAGGIVHVLQQWLTGRLQDSKEDVILQLCLMLNQGGIQ